MCASRSRRYACLQVRERRGTLGKWVGGSVMVCVSWMRGEARQERGKFKTTLGELCVCACVWRKRERERERDKVVPRWWVGTV
jgi:hypothetical protein